MDELTYRHQRLPFAGKVYWQRLINPWRLLVVVKALNISVSGILVQKPTGCAIDQTMVDVLQINDNNHTVVVSAQVVRQHDNQLAFTFEQTTTELEQLIADLSQQQT